MNGTKGTKGTGSSCRKEVDEVFESKIIRFLRVCKECQQKENAFVANMKGKGAKHEEKRSSKKPIKVSKERRSRG